jgi:ATP-dependent Lhr-like helicase
VMKVRDWPEIQVAVRTGDTPQRERAAIARRPPHILITTPESLNLMLTTASRTALSPVRYVIVDEVHALAGSKRGVFLSVLLERLEDERRLGNNHPWKDPRLKIAPGVYIPTEPLQNLIRIGLSATARPETLIGRWLAGNNDAGEPRPLEIVQTGQRKLLDLRVICPFATNSGDDQEDAEPQNLKSQDAPLKTNPAPVRGTGHWPEVTRETLRLIREHKGTLVFGNSRQLIERLAARFQEELLKEQSATPIENQKSKAEHLKIPVILPHHGSIAKEVRLETEQALKRGEVDAVLATSSLELGIDIGSLDLVVQIDSPGNVAAGLQRVGRSGHLERATAKGRFIARGLFDLPSFGALLPLMFDGKVEETRVPENCLDIVAQQIVAACAAKPWKRADLYLMFRREMPFASLSEKQFDNVVAMLS